jgi:hypothetical protein
MLMILRPEQYDEWLACSTENAPEFFYTLSAGSLVAPAARAKWGTRFSLRAASWPLLVGELRPLFRPPLERSGGATNGKPANAML